jgi:hypothetical protein
LNADERVQVLLEKIISSEAPNIASIELLSKTMSNEEKEALKKTCSRFPL